VCQEQIILEVRGQYYFILSSIVKVKSFEELKKAIKNKKIALAPLCKSTNCEDKDFHLLSEFLKFHEGFYLDIHNIHPNFFYLYKNCTLNQYYKEGL